MCGGNRLQQIGDNAITGVKEHIKERRSHAGLVPARRTVRPPRRVQPQSLSRSTPMTCQTLLNANRFQRSLCCFPPACESDRIKARLCPEGTRGGKKDSNQLIFTFFFFFFFCRREQLLLLKSFHAHHRHSCVLFPLINVIYYPVWRVPRMRVCVCASMFTCV